MPRQYGLLCPDGHGPLIERDEWTARGVAWCPNSEHDITDGTSGRFFRLQEVTEGTYDPKAPRAKTEAQLAMEEKAARLAAERQEVFTMAIQSKRAAKPLAAPKAPRVRAAKAGQPCGDGCGGTTKGGRFIPGHDARYHSRIKALVAAGVDHAEAESVAARGPLTGKYALVTAKPAKAEKAEAEPVTA